MSSINVKKLRANAILPTYGTAEAAGADLYACLEEPVTIAPGETVFIPTGLAMEVPKGCAGLVYARSGMASKRGLAPANKVGVIDSDYRGCPAADHPGAPVCLSGNGGIDRYQQGRGRIWFHGPLIQRFFINIR